MMDRVNWWRLPALLGVIVAVMAGLAFAKGGLVIAKHEGDTLHLADIVLRMAEFGQIPHLDIMTPLGVLSVAPIAGFVAFGLPLGKAFFAAQLAVALVLLGPAAYAAQSRFKGWVGVAYAAYVMILVQALVHGEAQSAVSISMHYNRWAWALAYIAVPLALLPARGRARPLLDGALIGAVMALLVLVKVTYFVGFAPAITVLLIARKQGRTLLAALLAGLVVAAIATLALGAEFWLAYLGDLLTVARSESRAAPGMSFAEVVSSPAMISGSLALLAGIMALRLTGRMTEGLGLMLLMPAFFYITYQNYGNDPQWLVMLAALIYALRAEAGVVLRGVEMRALMTALSLVALALGAGSLSNLAASPLRHFAQEVKDPVPLISGNPRAADLMTAKTRVYRVRQTQLVEGVLSPYGDFKLDQEDLKPTVLNGETLPQCELASGYNAYFEAVSRDLEGAGLSGAHVLAADLFGAFWLYGDFAPVRGSAPWYYAGLGGVAAADYLLVPLCATTLSQRGAMLKEIEKAGWGLQETRRSPLYILLKPVPPKG